VTRSRFSILIFLVLATALACAQTGPAPDLYLLRLEHGSAYSDSCVLLQKTGAYHLEIDDGDNTKVLEGSLTSDELQQVVIDLKNVLEAISQGQIEEPLLGHRDLLKLDVERHGHWGEVRFLSTESQEPYRQSLQPIVRWLSDLHKLPHKELSEDAAKNNCLAPGKIVLKKRSNETTPPSAKASSSPHVPSSQPSSPVSPNPSPALLRVDSFGLKSDVFHQECVLIVEDGSYRAEQRAQKSGHTGITTKINGGQLTPIEISQLKEVLSNPALARIRHRESSHLERPVMGQMMELNISRSSGLQDIVLSSTFDQPGIPFFYSGDGDISTARPLLKFLAEHVENNGLGAIDPNLRNGCQSAP
jgi:hypothetical protein